jgi:non-lysosomal glucosylceramidase
VRAGTASTAAPHLALPLGGIGTGNVAICADGSLRQWQLHNIGNHGGALPHTFFALRASRIEPPLDVVRILQASPIPASTATPLVTDDVAPR